MRLGVMGPAGGVATVEKVAVAAVMAGCLAEHVPVVIAAVQAVLQDEFDLAQMQSTTHCTAPLIIVNGPGRLSCGPIASGFGALGPGHRANASIGRALRLSMINIGGANRASPIWRFRPSGQVFLLPWLRMRSIRPLRPCTKDWVTTLKTRW